MLQPSQNHPTQKDLYSPGNDDQNENMPELTSSKSFAERTQKRALFQEAFSLLLNILGCFLYMMNYYIAGPTSTQYANALGLSDAMSGLIIGAMPWAAMFSSFAYSVWSNKCYRQPLLTSGLLLTVGNIMYASAYRRESFGLALLGRFITGLGGPKSMNRRYIADMTTLDQRTWANAAFGVATAMGSALGPAIAIVLDGCNYRFHVPVYGYVAFNGMTGPGYIMGLLWVVYTVIVAITFSEPEVRFGLEEQREKELAQLMTLEETDDVELPDKSNYLAVNDQMESRNHSNFNEEGLYFQNRRYFVATTINAARTCLAKLEFFRQNMTVSVRICMYLLFSKMFTVESVISAAPMITKNRYHWPVHKVGTLGTVVGCLTIPTSMFIGYISRYKEDRLLMICLMACATLGMLILIDATDFFSTPTETYNEGNILAVGPRRYVVGYSLVFCSVQAFDGVAGSVLSKVIPTALASGMLNSGLLSTFVGTFGRACGDMFITAVGLVNLRQVMNMLFVPSFIILSSDLFLIWWNYDILST